MLAAIFFLKKKISLAYDVMVVAWILQSSSGEIDFALPQINILQFPNSTDQTAGAHEQKVPLY